MHHCKKTVQTDRHRQERQLHKWHIWFCPTHEPTLRKTKRAIFAPDSYRDTEQNINFETN